MNSKKIDEDEIDLFVLFTKIKLVFNYVLLLFYRSLKKLILNWKTVLAVIILGFIIGIIQQNKNQHGSKNAKVLVKINFDAGSFVYDAVELIEKKIKSNDKLFFSEELFLSEDELINEIKISPIISFTDILNQEIKANEMRTLFENLDAENSRLDVFNSEYDFHVLELIVSGESDTQIISNVIDYFNRNPIFNELGKTQQTSYYNTISKNKKTIAQIDNLIDKFSSEKAINTSQLYVDNKDIGANELIKTKIELQQNNEDLKKELLLSANTVILINNSNVLVEEQSLLSNKSIFYSLLFLLIYILLLGLRSFINFLKNLDAAN